MTENGHSAAPSPARPRLAPVEDIGNEFVRFDNEAEMGALGCALTSPDAAMRVAEELRPADFYRNVHRVIFTAVESLVDRGENVNPLTVRYELERTPGVPEDLRSGIYLHTLVHELPVVAFADSYIKTLRALSPLRGLVQAAPRLAQLGATTHPEDVELAVEHAQKLLDDATRVSVPSQVTTVANKVTGYMERLAAGPGGYELGVPTGWADVDLLLGGLRPGNLIVIAGRPGLGKSVALANIAYHVGVHLGRPTWVGTLEMTEDEYMDRLVSNDASVNGHHLRNRMLSEAEWERLARSTSRLLEANTLEIDDNRGWGIGHMRARLRQMVRAGRPPAIALVDYLQLMQSGGRVENRQVEVSGFSQGLKHLAGEFGIPVVAAAQLNRGPEYRQDKKPVVSDLRESGSVEAEADVVILLDRPDAYEKESPRAGEIDLIVGKNRHGPTTTVTMAFQGHYSRIVDMAPEPRPPEPRPDWTPTAVLDDQ